MRGLLLVLLALSACSLLIDVDSVRRNRDAGAGGGDGGGAGGGAPTFSDTPCEGSPRYHLSCLPPVALPTDGGVGRTALAAADDGFLALIERPTDRRVELYWYGPDGGHPVGSWPVTRAVATLAVSGQGSAWAAAWNTSDFGVACVSGTTGAAAPATPTALTAQFGARDLDVAVNAGGGVALAVASRNNAAADPLRVGLGAAGCPAGLTGLPGAPTAWATSVIPLSASEFGFVASGDGLAMITPAGASWNVAALRPNDPGYAEVAAAPPGAAGLAFTVFDYLEQDGGLTLYPEPLDTDGGYDWLEGPALLHAPQAFEVTNCGPDCAAASMVPAEAPAQVSVALYHQDAALTPIGHGSYDVVCNARIDATGAGVAWSNGLLGVLYSDASRLELSLCQRPQ